VSENSNIVKASGLHKYFGNGLARVHALRGVDLEIRRGEFLAVMGPSGSGKSTLLHLLGLMTPPDEGTIELDGQLVPADGPRRTELLRTKIGFVFQRFNLLSVLTAEHNVAISLRLRGQRDRGQIRELFEQLDITEVARRKPGKMSIGQQQRVAVARALAHRPALLLADEPTGNLDSENASILLDLFRKTNRQRQQTIVMITHSAEAASWADRTVYMKDGTLVETK